MALKLQGTVLGRSRRLQPDGRSIVTLHILREEQVYQVQWWDLAPEDAPAVGEEVDLPVVARAYTDRSGNARIGLAVKDATRGRGETF